VGAHTGAASNASKEFAMKIPHSRHHWIAVALVLAALLLTLSEVHGQSTGSASVFEGRPAMAGAQAGLGAQAGPAQGGIGVQGSDAAQRSVDPRNPSPLDEMAQARRAATGTDVVAANTDADLTQRGDNVKPARDQSIAKDQRSSAKKVKRAAKRTATRSRHGVSEIDAR
jgi:hypothetical protein